MRHWSGTGEHSPERRSPWAKTTQIRSPLSLLWQVCSRGRESTTRQWNGTGEHSTPERTLWARTTQRHSPPAGASTRCSGNKGCSSRNVKLLFYDGLVRRLIFLPSIVRLGKDDPEPSSLFPTHGRRRARVWLFLEGNLMLAYPNSFISIL